MSMPWSKLQGAAKVAAICAAVLLVSAGLCGTQLLVAKYGARANNRDGVFIVTGLAELAAILISAIVGFIALLVWAIQGILRRHNDS